MSFLLPNRRGSLGAIAAGAGAGPRALAVMGTCGTLLAACGGREGAGTPDAFTVRDSSGIRVEPSGGRRGGYGASRGRRSRGSRRLPGAPERTWQLFRPDGAWLGALRVPSELEVMEVGAGRVVGKTRDELGVERAVVYRLVEP